MRCCISLLSNHHSDFSLPFRLLKRQLRVFIHFLVFAQQGFFNTTSNTGPNPPQHYQQQPPPHQDARPGERSPFSDINQQLVNMGFPTWHLGNQVVEPVMSILLLFLLMMVGVRGLLLVGLIYVVSHLSQRWHGLLHRLPVAWGIQSQIFLPVIYVGSRTFVNSVFKRQN